MGIHGVDLAFQLAVVGPLVLGHGAHIAQNVGSVGGGVLPDGGGFGLQARGVQLQNGGKGGAGGILNENVVGQIGDALPQIQFIPDADDSTGVLVGPILGDLVAFPQLADQQRLGNIRVQTAALGGKIRLKIFLSVIQ